jgi:hypothetical protein
MAKDALSRLNKLVAKGYVVQWGQSDKDTLRLEHPSGPLLTLYSDGSVWVDEQRFQSFASEDDWLTPDDVPRFDSLVDRIPKPTMLQSFKAMTVEDVWVRVRVWALVMFFSFGLALGVTFLIRWLQRIVL